MSETLDLTTVSDEPVESNVQVEITDADPEEPVADAEEPVVEPNLLKKNLVQMKKLLRRT